MSCHGIYRNHIIQMRTPSCIYMSSYIVLCVMSSLFVCPIPPIPSHHPNTPHLKRHSSTERSENNPCTNHDAKKPHSNADPIDPLIPLTSPPSPSQCAPPNPSQPGYHAQLMPPAQVELHVHVHVHVHVRGSRDQDHAIALPLQSDSALRP